MVTCVQILALILACLAVTHAGPPKKSSLGYEMGDLNDIQGVGIKGKVIFADKSTILLKNFFYGYPAPDMFFWADHNKFTDSGLKIPSRSGLDKLDSDYNGSDVTLKLPAGKSLKDYNIFGMFCKTYAGVRCTVVFINGKLLESRQFNMGIFENNMTYTNWLRIKFPKSYER